MESEPKMRLASRAALAALLLVTAGCGQIKIPKPLAPDELPRPAPLMKPAPAFGARARDGTTLDLADLAGRPSVVVGVDWRFAGDALAWERAVASRFGPPAERYRIVLLVEGADLGLLAELERLTADATRFLASPDFAAALGAIGEGPHVAVIGPDLVLLESVDGTCDADRFERVAFALQGFVPPVPAGPQP